MGQFSQKYRTFYPKSCKLSSQSGIRDPGSGKNLFRIQGSVPDLVSRTRIRNNAFSAQHHHLTPHPACKSAYAHTLTRSYGDNLWFFFRQLPLLCIPPETGVPLFCVVYKATVKQNGVHCHKIKSGRH